MTSRPTPKSDEDAVDTPDPDEPGGLEVAVADARQTVDDLIDERAGLPDRRAAALAVGDQAEFFTAETRATVIDGELVDAECQLARAELALAWHRADVAAAREADARVVYDQADDRSRDASVELRRLSGEAYLDAEPAARRARADKVAADRQLAGAIEATNLALVHVDEVEDRLATLTGEPAWPDDGPRARPQPVVVHVAAYGPSIGETTHISAGEIPPRWAVRLLGEHCWEGLRDRYEERKLAHREWQAEQEAAAAAARAEAEANPADWSPTVTTVGGATEPPYVPPGS